MTSARTPQTPVRGPSEPRGARLVLLQGGAGDSEPDETASHTRAVPQVAAAVAAVLADASDESAAEAPLALPLALSVCMERHALGARGLVEAMQSLRGAVLTVSGLDATGEPVPMITGDARTAAVHLAEYLRGLIARAARASAAAPDMIASAAAARLA